MMKTCTKCGETKSLDLFYKDKSKKDGYLCICKKCFKKRKEDYKSNDISKLKYLAFSTIIIENKFLKQEGYRLCGKCKKKIKIINSTNYCSNCVSENSKQSYLKNKNVVKERVKKYYEENKIKNKKLKKIKNKEYYLKKKLEKENIATP